MRPFRILGSSSPLIILAVALCRLWSSFVGVFFKFDSSSIWFSGDGMLEVYCFFVFLFFFFKIKLFSLK